MAQSELEKLKALINSDSGILDGIAGSGDVKQAAKALAAFAAERQIDLSLEEIEGLFAARSTPAEDIEPLDDEALENVSGGGSPYCIFTKGCYCIFTK